MRMHHQMLLLTTLWVMFSGQGCVDEVNLKIDRDLQKITVVGLISDSLREHTIEIFRSAVLGLGQDNIYEPISQAKVIVRDDAGTVIPFNESSTEGTYTATVKGVTGRTYWMEAELPDQTFIKSEPALLRPSPPIDSLTYEVGKLTFINNLSQLVEVEQVFVKATTQIDPGAKQKFRWRAEGEYEFHEYEGPGSKFCWIKNNVDFNQLYIFDAERLEGRALREQPVVSTEINERFAFKYCFHVTQYTISDREFNYWNQLKSIININGSLFDPPPGNVKGNLISVNQPDEQIFGYFSVCGSSFKRLFVKPQDLGFSSLPGFCRRRFGAPGLQECSDCRVIRHGTAERPEYWGF